MSKAEIFIKDCTRNCSNEIGYCHNKTRNHNHVFYNWLTPDQARKAVEIAKAEMIEKNSVWAKTHTCILKSMEEVDLYNQLLIKAMKNE